MPNNRIDDLLNMGSESEARMLGVEGERTAWPSSRHTSTGNIPRGMSMNEYWEVFPEEKPRLVKAMEGYVDFFDPNPAAKGVLDFMDSYEDLKGETEATAEGMLERAKQLKTLSTEEAQAEYDDELLQYESSFSRGEGLSSEGFPPEVMEILDDLMSGMVDPGKKFKGIMSLLKKLFKGGKGKLVIEQSTKRVPKDIAQRELDESRRLLEETPTPHPIRIPRKFNKKRYEDIDPTEKPPLKFKGGGHLYKKGYYGKSYR